MGALQGRKIRSAASPSAIRFVKALAARYGPRTDENSPAYQFH
jgi:hypothetical protein